MGKHILHGWGATDIDDSDQPIRSEVRKLLKHHGIVDGVLEADLTAMIKFALDQSPYHKAINP